MDPLIGGLLILCYFTMNKLIIMNKANESISFKKEVLRRVLKATTSNITKMSVKLLTLEVFLANSQKVRTRRLLCREKKSICRVTAYQETCNFISGKTCLLLLMR